MHSEILGRASSGTYLPVVVPFNWYSQKTSYSFAARILPTGRSERRDLDHGPRSRELPLAYAQPGAVAGSMRAARLVSAEKVGLAIMWSRGRTLPRGSRRMAILGGNPN